MKRMKIKESIPQCLKENGQLVLVRREGVLPRIRRTINRR